MSFTPPLVTSRRVASLFTHVFTAAALSAVAAPRVGFSKSLVLGMVSAVLPDADMLGYYAGVPSKSMFGHRGLTHSLVFALAWTLCLSWFLRRDALGPGGKLRRSLYFFLCIASHGVLDALSTGRHGVAFFAPFENGRHLLPGNVIPIAPLGVQNLFTPRGWTVFRSELLIVWLPLGALALLSWYGRTRARGAAGSS